MSMKYQAAALNEKGKAFSFTSVLANNKDEALHKAWAKFYEMGIKPISVKIMN